MLLREVTDKAVSAYSLEKESFRTECGCLAKNSECGPACGCRGQQCLNSAIQRRAALRLGRDVAERDTWGMDCYTRRNIQDGESLHVSPAVCTLLSFLLAVYVSAPRSGE